jgi:hypothetical protein
MKFTEHYCLQICRHLERTGASNIHGQWLYSTRDELYRNWSEISFALIGCLQGTRLVGLTTNSENEEQIIAHSIVTQSN